MRTVLVALVLTLAAAAPAAAQLQAPEPTPAPVVPGEPVIAEGVTAGGVDLSGLTVEQARVALREAIGRTIRKTVTLRLKGVQARLPTKKVKYEFDAYTTAVRASEAGAGEAVEVKVYFEREPIKKFVDGFAQRVYKAPVDAQVRIHVTRIGRTRAHRGRALQVKKTKLAIVQTLNDPTKSRDITPHRKRVDAAVGAKDLRDRYPAIITIDQSSFTLRLFKRLRLARSYSVAVGQSAYPTPNGLFSIQSKQVNPTWTAPNSPWAGELQGQSFSGTDPNNPLKARWMGVSGSVGIHGTAQDYSIGTPASHGCIRMHVADVINLFDRVSIGTPVLIAS
jgi:lipoprotein-anchoring transpeptidase ErfK/SrfK